MMGERARRVRNTMMHANYEEAAREAGISVEEYLRTQFAGEVEGLYRVLDY